MKLLQKQLEANHNLFFFGDKHTGSVLSSTHAWNAFVKAIQSPYDGCDNNYAVDGGDDMEAITVDDKRFSPEKLTEPLPLAQLNQCEQDLKPIKDKLLVILDGNHTRKLWRFGNLAEELATRLGTEYGTYTCKLSVNDAQNNLMYKVYVTHGFKSIRSTAHDPIRRKANWEYSLKNQLKDKQADCAVMVKHHAHRLLVSKPHHDLYLYDDGKKIKQNYTSWGQNEQYIHPDARWYGCAGSFLRLFGKDISGYAEVMELDPTELGFLVLRVKNKRIMSLEPYYVEA